MNIPLVSLQLVRNKVVQYQTHMSNVENATKLFQDLIGKSDREELAIIATDTTHQPVLVQIIGKGDKGTCIASIPEILKAAIIANASHLFIGHNHPSGNCEPSKADVRFTIKMRKAGNLLGIDLTDHIIVSDGDHYYSFLEHAHLWDSSDDHREVIA